MSKNIPSTVDPLSMVEREPLWSVNGKFLGWACTALVFARTVSLYTSGQLQKMPLSMLNVLDKWLLAGKNVTVAEGCGTVRRVGLFLPVEKKVLVPWWEVPADLEVGEFKGTSTLLLPRESPPPTLLTPIYPPTSTHTLSTLPNVPSSLPNVEKDEK